MDKPHPLLKADAIRNMPEYVRQHQFNENAVRHTKSIGDHLGLRNIGVHLVRLEPGRESTQFHFHHQDEEFLYILSGKAVAEIGDEEYEVGPGDFMGFTAHSLPHSMRNPFDEDLVYIMGGDRNPIDVCDYPRIKRRMYRENGVKQYLDLEHLHDVDPKVR